MILRFSYDLEGKGLEKEPGSIRLVEEHMQQIGEVIREYADDIFAVQGILIGNWGEMHGSRYLTPGCLSNPDRYHDKSSGRRLPGCSAETGAVAGTDFGMDGAGKEKN